MADFGPKIFHALAHLADADAAPGATQSSGGQLFKTLTDLSLCGFLDEEIDINGEKIDVAKRIETLKNAIFKTLMLRARNTLYIHHSADGTELEECEVSLTLRVSSSFLHGQKPDNTDQKTRLNAKELAKVAGGEHRILPTALDGVFPDSSSSVHRAANLNGVCADNQLRLKKAFKNDEIYQLLPDFKKPA